VLSGTPPAAGTSLVNVTATLGDYGVSAGVTLNISPAVIFSGSPEVGAKGVEFFDAINYQGAGQFLTWQLSGAPDGIAITSRAIAINTMTTVTVWAMEGVPAAGGEYFATLAATVQIAGIISVIRTPITFLIAGDLFLPWLHVDPTLYDLQVQQRGDAATRVVRSYYGVPAAAATTAQITAVAGSSPDTTTTITNVATPAAAGQTLTLKRNEAARLAVVISDGPNALAGDVISNVQLCIIAPDAEDGDFLFNVACSATVLTGGTYYAAFFTVTDPRLDLLMAADADQTLAYNGEITWQYNGHRCAGAAFPVSIIEQIAP
jgi:hypothetical protein